MTLLQYIQLQLQSYRLQATPESRIHAKQVLFVLNRLNGTIFALAQTGTLKPKKNGSQRRVQITYPARLYTDDRKVVGETHARAPRNVVSRTQHSRYAAAASTLS